MHRYLGFRVWGLGFHTCETKCLQTMPHDLYTQRNTSGATLNFRCPIRSRSPGNPAVVNCGAKPSFCWQPQVQDPELAGRLWEATGLKQICVRLGRGGQRAVGLNPNIRLYRCILELGSMLCNAMSDRPRTLRTGRVQRPAGHGPLTPKFCLYR